MHSIFFVPSAGSARGVVHASSGNRIRQQKSNRRLQKQMWCAGALALAMSCVSVLLSGCGSIMANAASGSLVASANSLSFGSVALGQTSSASVSVKNESAAAVQISGVSVTGPFSVMGQSSMPVTLAAGGSYAVSLQFTPTSVGAATGSLTLTSNATSGNPVVSLSGTGMADAPASAPGAMISPAPGSVLPGSSVTFTWSAGSGVAEYQLWLGSTGAGSQNLGVFTEGVAAGNTVSATASGLPTTGATLYVRLLSEISGNWQSTDYTYTEASTVDTPVTTVSAVSCTSATITGAGTDTCTVTLSAPASSGGASVSLASSDSAVTVPSSVLIGANRSSATFTAIAAAVSATQTATITASVGTSSATFALQLSPQAATGTAALSLSASSLAFGDVTVNTQATPQFVTLLSSGTAALTINSATVAGAGFTIAGQSFPVTLNPGNSVTVEVKFDPATAGAATGTLTVVTNAPTNGTALVSLSGTGDAAAGTLSTLFCQSGTITGAGSDACTVNLTAAAPAGGLTVNLSSSNTALTVPATVTVPAGAMGAFFTATATAVTSNETANVTATAGGLSKIYALQLVAQTPGLSVSTTSLNFGDVTVNTSTTETVTLTSSGTAPLTVNSATLTGTDFSMSGATFPATLNPGQSATLQVSFDPATVGGQTGTITISSNSATNGTVVVALSGTGQSAGGTLSGVSCANGTISGAASDSCTVSLSSAAPTGGLTVTLSSNSSSVTVPASVTVAAGARTAGFTATVAAVTSTQAATLTATASGVSKVYTLQLDAQTAGMSLSTNSLSFGDVTINTSTSQSVTVTSSGTAPLTINTATLTGTGFTLGGATIPVTLNPGQSATLQVTFDPTTAGAEAGTVLITSNATTNPTATISLSGTGDTTAGALSSLTCTTMSYSAAGTDACTVTLSAAAPAGGLVVTLASNNSAVTVPASVTVAAAATTAPFTATIAAVTSTQTATLTATASGVAKTAVLQLTGGSIGLTLGSTSVAFGNVNLNTPTTQTVLLTSSGTAAVTISAATLTGTGFTMSGVTAPVTLSPGQTETLDLVFDPTTAGAATGLVTITSNATSGATATIALSGAGVSSALYEVQLTWDAPTETTDPAVGYNVYRSTGSGSYELLNTSVNTPTTFTDTTVASGSSYNYEVTSVDASGVESAPSNVYTAAIP